MIKKKTKDEHKQWVLFEYTWKWPIFKDMF